MAVKIVFIGNVLAGDDGIGPYMFEQLKGHKDLSGFKVMDMGVLGIDLLSIAKEGDHVIIIDALLSDSYGEVVKVDDYEKGSFVSQHDFGIEHTTAMLKALYPGIRIDIIGIKVNNIRSFDAGISPELLNKQEEIKASILERIRCATQYLQR